MSIVYPKKSIKNILCVDQCNDRPWKVPTAVISLKLFIQEVLSIADCDMAQWNNFKISFQKRSKTLSLKACSSDLTNKTNDSEFSRIT